MDLHTNTQIYRCLFEPYRRGCGPVQPNVLETRQQIHVGPAGVSLTVLINLSSCIILSGVASLDEAPIKVKIIWNCTNKHRMERAKPAARCDILIRACWSQMLQSRWRKVNVKVGDLLTTLSFKSFQRIWILTCVTSESLIQKHNVCLDAANGPHIQKPQQLQNQQLIVMQKLDTPIPDHILLMFVKMLVRLYLLDLWFLMKKSFSLSLKVFSLT